VLLLKQIRKTTLLGRAFEPGPCIVNLSQSHTGDTAYTGYLHCVDTGIQVLDQKGRIQTAVL
jgi:hypothetical protein